MKFVCDSCKTKYAIDDARVRGKVLKVRCKACGNLITVSDPLGARPAVAPSVTPPPADTGAGEFGGADRTMISSGPPADLQALTAAAAARAAAGPASGTADWFVSFDGEQEGPHTLEKARARIAEQKHDVEMHVWRDGYAEWLPIEKVPELLSARRSAPPPPSVRPPPEPARPPVAAALDPVPAAARAASATAIEQPAPALPSVNVGSAAADQAPQAAAAPAIPSVSTPSSAQKSPAATEVPLAAAPAAAASPSSPQPSAAARSLTPAATAAVAQADSDSPTRLDFAAAAPLPGNGSAAQKTKEIPVEARATVMTEAPKVTGLPTNGSTEKSGGIVVVDKSVPDAPPAPTAPAATVSVLAPSGFGDLGLGPISTTVSALPPVLVVQPQTGWVKVALGLAALVIIGLGSAVAYLAQRRPPVAAEVAVAAATVAPPVAVAPPPKRIDDPPVAVGDPMAAPVAPAPAAGAGAAPAGAAPAAGQGRHGDHHVAAAAGAKPHAGASGAPAELSAEQKELAKMYGGESERSTPGAVPQAGHAEAQHAQVSDSAIMGVVSRNKKSLTACWERALKHEGQQHNARLDVELKIGVSGSVTNVNFPDPSYANSEIGVCLKQTIKHWHFPEQGEEYQTAFPLFLQAQ